MSARPLGVHANGGPSPEQAAAVVAAVERFMRATARPSGTTEPAPDGWQRAAILEGVERDSENDVSDPWLNT